uniref:UPF0739 protein C1orf74 homolog n=1 Tax=Styela clava TaxID=7725 RepID=UPI00193A27B2|nr:UPF0739 protein C1orf74 homolog [Styela clava]
MADNVTIVRRYLMQKRKRNQQIPQTSSILCFLKNLHWIYCGTRPAYIPELVTDVEPLKELLQKIRTNPNSATTYNISCICILSLEGHNLIVNVKTCASHLESIFTHLNIHSKAKSKGFPLFIDISKTNLEPTIANNEDLMLIAQSCQTIYCKLYELPNTSNAKSCIVALHPQANLCTLFGCILGYPTIYFFKANINESNCLEMVPLTIFKVIDHESNEEYVSFSYPSCLQNSVESSVKHWCDNMTSNDSLILLKRDVVQLPFVVL